MGNGQSPVDDSFQPTSYFDKQLVLEEARQHFMGTGVKTKKLVDTLTKCIAIIPQVDDERLTQQEAIDLFFHITRLFQYKSKDGILRRLTYIAIKALSPRVENKYVVFSSLMSDIKSPHSDISLRAAALRTICQVADTSTYEDLEPILKQSITSEHPEMVSTALSSMLTNAIAQKLVSKNLDEIRGALKSDSNMVQYQSLALLNSYYENDPAAISKLIDSCMTTNLKSPMARCLLIRIISKYIEVCGLDAKQSYIDFIKHNLISESDLVEYEAAHTILSLKSISKDSLEHKSAISHLRNFLTSKKASLRFASVRTLNELTSSSASDIRFWSIHRIGNVCKLHLLNKRHRVGDSIIGILDFETNSQTICAKYTIILQCEETQQYEVEQEFSLGLTKNEFTITIPPVEAAKSSVLHCVLSFLFYMTDKSYPRPLFEDRAGTIELGPSELDTKLFSCDFPIAIYT